MMPDALAPGPCGTCLRRPPAQRCTESLYIYRDGPVRNAVLDWKLHGDDAGVNWLLQTATARLQQLFGPRSLLLPVPMPLSRMRRAGHHHAADLCRTITGLSAGHMEWRLLRREGLQQRQSSLSGRARWKNLRKAFAVNRDYLMEYGDGIRDMQLWVVDDIMTTGATMHFACQALRRAGLNAAAFSLTRLAGHH